MIDPFAAASGAVADPSPATAGALVLAGLLTSIGPCAAPRYAAIAAAAAGGRRAAGATAAYVAGTTLAFALLAQAAQTVAWLARWSCVTYALVALAFIAAGVRAIVSVPHACGRGHDGDAAVGGSVGAMFLAGAASTLVVSPCCTPVVAALGSLAAASGRGALTLGFVACYALGHTLPLVAAGTVAGRVTRRCTGPLGTAPAVVGGTLAIALGAYYALLAA